MSRFEEFKDLVSGLKNKEVSELVYALTLSGKVVIPEYYQPKHIKGYYNNCKPTVEDMLMIQEKFHSDNDLQDMLSHKIGMYLYLDDVEKELIE